MNAHHVELLVNGRRVQAAVPARTTLADLLRDHLGLTGTHLGCEQGGCGACTVLLDGEPVRSCIVLAVQAMSASVTTIEGVALSEGLHPLQQAFLDQRAFQCGFCTPGMIMCCLPLVERGQVVDHDEAVAAIAGNVCRCTGYWPIVAAVRQAAAQVAAGHESPGGAG